MQNFQVAFGTRKRSFISDFSICMTVPLIDKKMIFPFLIHCLYYLWDTPSSIHHRFDVEIPRGKFVEISSILKDESTWKLLHRFNVEISTWIRLSKSTKYRWVFHEDFSMLFLCWIAVVSVFAVSILLFPNIFCSENLF